MLSDDEAGLEHVAMDTGHRLPPAVSRRRHAKCISAWIHLLTASAICSPAAARSGSVSLIRSERAAAGAAAGAAQNGTSTPTSISTQPGSSLLSPHSSCTISPDWCGSWPQHRSSSPSRRPGRYGPRSPAPIRSRQRRPYTRPTPRSDSVCDAARLMAISPYPQLNCASCEVGVPAPGRIRLVAIQGRWLGPLCILKDILLREIADGFACCRLNSLNLQFSDNKTSCAW